MRAGLVSYFDIGFSIGLTDDVLSSDHRNAPVNIGLVGIQNPLGQGVTVDLRDGAFIRLWRDETIAQVRREDMETGWKEEWTDLPRATFNQRLIDIIDQHPVTVCKLTLHSLGIVYFRFELGAAIPPRFAHGVLACFEFAAYRPAISMQLLKRGPAEAHRVNNNPKNKLIELTIRPDPGPQKDATGYEESNLFSAFTHLLRLIDPEDGQLRDEMLELLGMGQAPIIEFEYHGKIHYGWSTCLLTPRRHAPWTPEQELARIMECIRIAHISVGICEAFLKLFQDEINTQVEWYVSRQYAGRGPEQLNQLRTLALAVVNLTKFGRVTQSGEDQEYFQHFAQDSSLDQTQQLLADSVYVLYNVQDAEAQTEQLKRDTLLNTVL